MTTNSLARRFTDARMSSGAALPERRAASGKLTIGVLTLVFSLSFLQYCFERNDIVRLAPISVLLAGTLLVIVVCPREKGQAILSSVIRPITVLMITIVSVPPLLSALDRESAYPLQYGLVMVVTLVAVRILLSAVGLEELLLSFFYATTFSMLIVVGITFSELLISIGSERYAPLFFDPNRTGFFAVTSIPAQLWFATQRRGKKYVLLVSVLCVVVIVAASSRGSAGALLIGAAVCAALYIARLIRQHSLAISRQHVAGALALLFALTVVVAVERPASENTGNYLWTKMELDSHDRGLDSGFTGRTSNWTLLLDVLQKTSWLLGNGYRTTDDDFGFAVDNGYLSSVYEIGLLSTTIVVAKYVLVISFLSVAYVVSKLTSDNCLLALVFTFVVFLSNAFVHRVMFGYGDPASLLALFAFVSSRKDLSKAIRAVPAQSI